MNKYYCQDCHTEISKRTVFYRNHKYCSSCSRKGNRNHRFNGASICPICKNKKIYKSKLCMNCYKQSRYKITHCLDCNKQLSRNDCKRCHSCEMRRRHQQQIFIVKKIKYKNIWMRSSWEVAYATYLDKNNIKWLYESQVFKVKEKLYIPDFYLPKTNTYIEIKGFWRNNAKVKFDMFKKLNPKIKIKVLYKKDLQQLNILKRR